MRVVTLGACPRVRAVETRAPVPIVFGERLTHSFLGSVTNPSHDS
jgi:hypothetical protein